MKCSDTIGELLQYGYQELLSSKIQEARLDAQLFLCKATGFTKIQLYTQSKQEVDSIQKDMFQQMLNRRKKGEPTQYILGECEFMSLPFLVTPSVLIPRPDTEILVEEVLGLLEKQEGKNMIDIGTGTGCIPISLAYYNKVRAIGVDISEDVLCIAKKNAYLNHVEEKITWIKSDLFENLGKQYYAWADIITSNPPYIESGEISSLMREVRNFEPKLALDGGIDGLIFYRRIAQQAKNFLKRGGFLIFEIGYRQALAVRSILEENQYQKIKVLKDLAGLDRVVVAQKAMDK